MHHMFTYKENVFKELFLDKLGMFDLPLFLTYFPKTCHITLRLKYGRNVTYKESVCRRIVELESSTYC